MNTKVQLIAPLDSDTDLNIYYVRDQFGRTWNTVASDAKQAKDNITHGEDVLTYKLYTTAKMGESLPEYDFKNLILGMMEEMNLQDTYEYEEVIGWDREDVFQFFRESSLRPCNTLIEIHKFLHKRGVWK
ncbi:hypothetical protein [Paenibacillus donghaensis]|uniref:Uncharacterized protein n=1 Tax=Paenibacillus donghaensis TaxID=414771 RepID=A0A2Z2KQX9_9BACL|nr:hypothetical protein [Paenibacillus donghaensis]ASA22771.1 hypothetical protein B9T62_19380 [Paenibacillus donghaensis]